MTEMQEVYFELLDGGNIVRVEPLELIKINSELDWDKNWIKTKVTVKGGAFSGQYLGDFMTIDFERFKQELSRLYNNLQGAAKLNDLEGFLELKIAGDGIGHFAVNVNANDQPGAYGSQLTFTMSFDQTELIELIYQLDRITKQFPISGEFDIKNE